MMRLLNTNTQELTEFSHSIPPYAILSHQWGAEEVTFEDLARPNVVQMQGFTKLYNACQLSRTLGYNYLWMDTCCIDKSSSAELSETLNSMHSYYKYAGICIAHLGDTFDTIEEARWFTRGWTLQDLLAPVDVIFVGREWITIGTRSSLAKRISKITGIDEKILLSGDIEDVSVATKMSWMANRQTSLVEDMAYSLMGIFGVNMPIQYGEKEKAFFRLQEEIMKSSNDQSIFAWHGYVLNGHITQSDLRIDVLIPGKLCTTQATKNMLGYSPGVHIVSMV